MLRSPAGDRAAATRAPEARLAEAVGLARAINMDVAASEIVRLRTWRATTLVTKGVMEMLGAKIAELGVGIVVIDASVTPAQQRNLERAWKCKVIDRTGLILEIFGARARTHEGALQVELASLTYQRTRLVRSWTHLERQRGGFGFMGGPGESQLETDRRLITDRITLLKRELEQVRRTRALHRKGRKRVPYPVAALVGYTNAGKSTLFNRLTEGDVVAADRLFQTLDPTMRRLALPSGRQAILSDTVGFISDLPHQLVAAFRATLEEVMEADLIVHVRDIHHPDTEAQRTDVHAVLAEMGLGEAVEHGLIEALNKTDLLPPAEQEALANQARRNHDTVPMSAATGEGCAALVALMDERLASDRRSVQVAVPLEDGATLAWLYRNAEVLHRTDDDTSAQCEVRISEADLSRLNSRLAQ